MKQLLTILFFSISITVNATTYYVSNTGDDSNSGLTEVLAWKTLDKVNSFTDFEPGDNILFKRGDTWYGKLVVSNSGSSGSPITYGTYGFGDAPVITGFTNVSGWTDLGFNVWESSSAVSSLPTLKLVLINGVNTPMGRYPNGSSTYPYLPNFYTFQSHTGTGSGSTSITSSSLTDGNNWTGADIVVRVNQYTLDRATITGQSGTTINYTGQAGTIADGWGFFIQNDTRTLDTQNEWYYDPSTKKLRIYSTTQPTDVKITTVDTLLYNNSKQYLSISNIKFTGANTSAIVLPEASHSSITDCEVEYTGDIAIDVYGTINTLDISDNTITNCGSSAIWGRGYLFTIMNNSIKNAGVVSGYKANNYTYGAIAITSPSSPDANHLIQYNQIDSCDYNGIQFRGAGVQVRNNYINYPCLLRGDGGGIYTGFANETGKVIDGNIVLNSKGNYAGIKSGAGKEAHGIYIDDLGNNMTIENNTIAGCSNAGLFLHNTKNITVRSNTIYNNGDGNDFTKGQLFIQNGSGTSYDSYARGNIIKSNSFIAKNANQYSLFYDAANSTNYPQQYGVWDSNYYARPIDDNLIINVLYVNKTLAQWKTYLGQDANSKGSQRSVSNTSQLSFYYNPNNYDSTVSLGSSTYVDMANTSYTGDVVLPAYSSLTLINTGTLITPVISWSPASVTYPNGLGAGQLNAVAMDGATVVPGTHSYLHGTGYIGNVPGISNTDSFTPSDPLTYTTATKTVTIPVNPQSVSLAFSDTIKTYTGAALLPTLTATPNVSTSITLNGVTGGKINVGTYTAIGGVTDPNSTATSITASFTINKATATINAVNQEFNYDGLSHSISYTTYPTGLNVVHSYSSGTAPTEIGTYTDTLRMVENNYEAGEIVRTITIVENAAIIFISDTSKIYNGSAQGVTVTSSYPHVETYNGSETVPTNAGVYEVITTINDGVHTGADTATLTILPKQAVLSYSKPENVQYGTLYSTAQQKATADVPGTFIYSFTVGNIIPLGLNTISATFTPDSPNYSGGTVSSTVTSFPGNNSPEIYITPNYFKKRLN